MTKVVPAIIPQTRRQLTEEIKKVSGFAELVQIDISDGLFTPIKTWPYNGRDQDFFEKLKKGEEGWPEWDKVDFIQVMGNDHLGKHGMELDFKAVELIKSLRKLYPERTIAIDIGVNTDTVETLVSAGANKLISGSEILDADNPKEVYKYFKSIGK